MSDFDFKKHSLERLKEWLYDAINQPDVSSQEIYNTIINVVEEHVNYYQKGFEKTNELLSLFKERMNNDLFENVKKEYDEHSLNYEEAIIRGEKAIKAGWTMTDDGFWLNLHKIE